MKRTGFLALLGGLPFIGKALVKPLPKLLPWQRAWLDAPLVGEVAVVRRFLVHHDATGKISIRRLQPHDVGHSPMACSKCGEIDGLYYLAADSRPIILRCAPCAGVMLPGDGIA